MVRWTAGWMVMMTLAACGEDRPVSTTEYDTTCDEIAATTGCEAYDACCTEAVFLEDGEEVERREDSCWFEHADVVYDCSAPANCTDAGAAVRAAACPG